MEYKQKERTNMNGFRYHTIVYLLYSRLQERDKV